MDQCTAASPDPDVHLRTGAAFAIETLRYDRAVIDRLPTACTARFAGVGNPHRAGTIPAGATVLDHACGAGMDLLVAATQAGRSGRFIGVDMTPAMLDHAADAAWAAGIAGRTTFHRGLFEALPLDAASVDVVISNGVLNLSADKPRAMREIVRVLRPGGLLLLADVVDDRALRVVAPADAAPVGRVLSPGGLVALARDAGLTDAAIVETYDCFRGTRVESTSGRTSPVRSASLFARKRALRER